MISVKIKELLRDVGFKKYFFNTSWLFATQGARLFVGFFVSLWVARYLGPELYGKYNYVTSWIYIFVAISAFGISDILVKRLIESKNNERDILNTAFYLRLITGSIAYILLVIVLLIFPQQNNIQKLIYLISPILLISAFDIIDFFYIAKVKAKESSLIRIIQLLSSAGIKVCLIVSESELIYFILMTVFDSLFYSIIIYYKYRRHHLDFIFKSPQIKEIKNFAKQAFPLMILSLSTILFIRTDQILIGNLVSQKQLGIYSSGIKIIELISIFSLITTQSLFPAILNVKTISTQLYSKRFTFLSRILLGSNLIITLALVIFSEIIILLLFGEDFKESKNVLTILAITIPFIGMQNVSYRWYIAENLQSLLILKSVMLPITNILLNLFLIPKYGIKGAAYASLISYICFFFFFELFFKKTRVCFFLNIGINKYFNTLKN